MATAFKQVKNGAKSIAVSNALNNTTSPLTFSVAAGTGTKFPQPGNSFYVTAYNSATYADPNDDPNMRIGLCTARSTDSLTVTWGQLGTSITAITGTPDIRLVLVDQALIDIHTAINTLEAAGYITGNSPVITTPTGLVKSDVGLGNVDNTSDATKNAASATLANKTLTTPTIGSFVNATHTHANAAGGGQIADAGISGVSTSKLANPYKFSVYRNAAANSTGSFAKVNFDTKVFDTGSNFDATTNFRFIAPIAGFYFFNWNVATPLAATPDNVAALYKNGTIFQWGTEVNIAGTPGSAFVQAAANDFFEVFVVAGGGTQALGVGGSPIKTYFQGFLLSVT